MKAYKQFTFDVAHQLPDWPGLHGHSYMAEVWLEGPATQGYVLPERDLTQLTEALRTKLDHSYLNTFIPLPTSENIARWVWQALQTQLQQYLQQTTPSAAPAQQPRLLKVRIFRGSVGFGVEYSADDARAEGLLALNP